MNRILVFALVAFGSTTAYGDLLDFNLAWSGASFGNTASATGTITLDDSFLLNPGNNSLLSNPAYINSFSITVNGSAGGAGDGTWNLADYGDIIFQTDTMLDLSQELIGQPTSMDPWGTSQPGGTGGDFNLFNGPAGAPFGTFFFELTVGSGEQILMTNFTPTVIPEPTGMAVLGILTLGLVTNRRRS